jgi:hypothetical protein
MMEAMKDGAASEARGGLTAVERQVAFVLGHPGTSRWLKQALHEALERDPESVLNDLEILVHVLRRRSLLLIATENDRGPS